MRIVSAAPGTTDQARKEVDPNDEKHGDCQVGRPKQSHSPPILTLSKGKSNSEIRQVTSMKKLALLLLCFAASLAHGQQIYRNAALTSTAVVQAAQTNLYGYYIYNPNASACSLDFFTTATPTLGTTVPRLSLVIPATTGANLSFPPLVFPTAMSVAAVTAAGGASTCGTGMTVNLFFQ